MLLLAQKLPTELQVCPQPQTHLVGVFCGQNPGGLAVIQVKILLTYILQVGDYDLNAALGPPELDCWATGYSNDSGTPLESEYPPGSVYEYAPESYYDETQDQDYYYGDEECTNKNVNSTNEFIPLTVLVMSHIQDIALSQPPMLLLGQRRCGNQSQKTLNG